MDIKEWVRPFIKQQLKDSFTPEYPPEIIDNMNDEEVCSTVAEFFSNIANVDDRYYADDYRLSAFGAISGGLRLRRDIGNWSVNLAGERYMTDESWGVYSGDESPGLVDYWRYSIGLDYIFR